VDRKIEKKTWNSKRILTIAGITGIILLVGGSIYFTSGKSKLDVDTERITISTITKGPFQEFIPVNGTVMPLTTIFLDATEGGEVEERYVDDGAMLKKGDPILKLSNVDEELNLATQESAVFAEQTQMQISHNNATQATITKLNTMADVDNAFKEAKRVYDLDKRLYEQKAIGLQDYQSAKNMYDYQVNRKKLAIQILKQDTSLVKQQDVQAQEHYTQMKAALALMRKKVSSLTLRAPIDGQLTNLDAEVGQSKAKGIRLGQIDVQSGFKVRVDIDEHYLSRVFPGLKGDFQFAEKTYNMVIKKVFTTVTAGRFQVDMQFVGAVPQGVLTDGLNPGDKVITSSYETYGDIQELVLKK
jgi:HlyD family secretion protein